MILYLIMCLAVSQNCCAKPVFVAIPKQICSAKKHSDEKNQIIAILSAYVFAIGIMLCMSYYINNKHWWKIADAAKQKKSLKDLIIIFNQFQASYDKRKLYVLNEGLEKNIIICCIYNKNYQMPDNFIKNKYWNALGAYCDMWGVYKSFNMRIIFIDSILRFFKDKDISLIDISLYNLMVCDKRFFDALQADDVVCDILKCLSLEMTLSE